jgi:hypothetical protein
MKSYLVSLVLISGLLAGCGSFFPHTRMHTESVVSRAQSMAMVNACMERGFILQDVGFRYGFALTQYLSAVVYDEALYEQTYQSTVAMVQDLSYTEIKTGCETNVSPVLQASTADLQQQTNAAIGWKAAGMHSMANQTAATANSIGNNARQMGESSMAYQEAHEPAAHVNPNSSQNQGGYKHYIINTPNGLKQCSVSSSGYVSCT